MKKYFIAIIAIALLFTSCHKNLWNTIEDLDRRVTQLEELCKEMNTNINSLQIIIAAQQSGDYITNVVPIVKDGVTIGYTITFAKHDAITIYNGSNGTNGSNGSSGTDGKDGTPVVGITQGTDGVYYWTINGEIITDASGTQVPVTGNELASSVTPKLKIEDGYWYVSYDNGSTWEMLGKATGENGNNGSTDSISNCIFSSVTQTADSVIFTLTDGTIISLPIGNQSSASTDSVHSLYGVHNGHAYVDMGLPSGTLWATESIIDSTGALTLFAWGEVSSKTFYTFDNYVYAGSKTNTYTKYGSVDGKYELELADDAANVLWGGNWRTPSEAQVEELRANCAYSISYLTLTTSYGEYTQICYTFVSKKNGNVLLISGGDYNYMTRVLKTDISPCYFRLENLNFHIRSSSTITRCEGFYIHPCFVPSN